LTEGGHQRAQVRAGDGEAGLEQALLMGSNAVQKEVKGLDAHRGRGKVEL
jgi:hypothetical protein